MTTIQVFEEHTQWETVKEVCLALKKAGFQALLAGGCVRDLLMKRTPNDFDIATDATPDQVESIFPNSITVGKAFGVTILPYDRYQIEVATFREDLEYKDGRRPEGVKFSTAKADAQRRDFTVNALFLDPDQLQVIDYVEGEKDIRAKVLRTVGQPELRFAEDKLRILRAIRFAAQLDLEIAPETMAAVIEQASEVSVVSRERVRDELFKLLKTPERVKGLSLLLSTGVLSKAFPETAPYILQNEDEWLKRFTTLQENTGSEDLVFLLALFLFPAFRGSGEKDFRERQPKTLKIDSVTSDLIVFALRNIETLAEPSKLRRGELILLLNKPGSAQALMLTNLLELLGEGSFERDRSAIIQNAKQSARDALGNLRAPFLNGQDPKNLGVKPGPQMGELLNEAYLLQLEDSFTSREDALSWAKKQI